MNFKKLINVIEIVWINNSKYNIYWLNWHYPPFAALKLALGWLYTTPVANIFCKLSAQPSPVCKPTICQRWADASNKPFNNSQPTTFM